MYSPVQLAWKYLKYYTTAANGRGHGIHSPYVFSFVTKVLNDRREYPAYSSIEALRRQLLADHREIPVRDFGAGSGHSKTDRRTISSIARHAAKPAKLGKLLHRIAAYYRPATILELGTSLGLSSAYLASAQPDSRLITLEGAPAILGEAKKNFSSLGLNNIEAIDGNFDETLTGVLEQLAVPVDLAFIDGNHRYEPTMRYVQSLLGKINSSSIIILDDIHWSREMEQAWKDCCQMEAVTLSMDLFFIGLLVFRKEIREKQSFVIRF